MAPLGQDLKRQREARGISLEDMASSTKIVGRYLEALENDRFAAMPAGFFIKGIIRTYADFVGLDANEVLGRYREAGVFDEPAKAHGHPAVAGAEPERRNRLVAWGLIGGGVLLVIVLAVLWSHRRPRPAPVSAAPRVTSSVGQSQPAASPASSLPSPPSASPPAEKVEKQAAEPAPVREEWKGLTMDFSFREETWIQVSTDGVPKIIGLFQAGEKARAQAEKEILIAVLGNAGGVIFQLNGRPGKVLGRSGQVLNNVRITLENLKEFLQAEQPTGPSN
jgi:transcriptional regulator with XRE-family HTH domain